MRTGYLVLHGIQNNRPPEHWHFQLAAELSRCGEEVRYPGLPEPDAPSLDIWLQTLDDELAALRGERRVVVCHSLACLLWFHAVTRGLDAARAVDRVLLVAPPDSNQVPEPGATFRLDRFDVDAVRNSAASELAIVCSDDDPYNKVGAQALYGDKLGIVATIIEGGGHITPDRGYGRWRFAEDWCWRHPS